MEDNELPEDGEVIDNGSNPNNQGDTNPETGENTIVYAWVTVMLFTVFAVITHKKSTK